MWKNETKLRGENPALPRERKFQAEGTTNAKALVRIARPVMATSGMLPFLESSKTN